LKSWRKWAQNPRNHCLKIL